MKSSSGKVVFDQMKSAHVHQILDQIRLWTTFQGILLPFLSWSIPPKGRA